MIISVLIKIHSQTEFRITHFPKAPLSIRNSNNMCAFFQLFFLNIRFRPLFMCRLELAFECYRKVVSHLPIIKVCYKHQNNFQFFYVTHFVQIKNTQQNTLLCQFSQV